MADLNLKMRWLLFLFAAALFSMACAKPYDAETAEPTFETEYGTMVGKRVMDSDVFLGVPFAKPPVDELRFKAPEPLENSTGKNFQTKTIKPDCMQDNNGPYKNVNEDCLYLNIFKPSTPKTKDPLPVLVFIPGGNFVTGGCSLKLYDATMLATDIDAIVVCVNYRLGAFGFLYYKDEEKWTKGDILGNFGLKDQIEALKFVKNNIGTLGGNPKKITLAGQSAGAQSVAYHLTSEQDNDFFQQAILISDPFSISFKHEKEAHKLAVNFLKELGCEKDVTSCLYSRTAEDILEISSIYSRPLEVRNFFDKLDHLKRIFDGKVFHMAQPWGPTVEVQPITLFKSVDKPVMMGSLSGDASMFPLQDLDQHPIFSFSLLFNEPDSVYKKYKDWYNDDLLFTHFITDYMFTCPARQMALDINSTPVYHYYFDHVLSFSAEILPPRCVTQACHASDLPFFFHSASFMNFEFTGEEEIMLDKYTRYLANFIHHGDPNEISDNSQPEPAKLSPWNPINLNPGNTWTMVFSTNESIVSKQGIQKEQCDYWDKTGYYDVTNINRK